MVVRSLLAPNERTLMPIQMTSVVDILSVCRESRMVSAALNCSGENFVTSFWIAPAPTPGAALADVSLPFWILPACTPDSVPAAALVVVAASAFWIRSVCHLLWSHCKPPTRLHHPLRTTFLFLPESGVASWQIDTSCREKSSQLSSCPFVAFFNGYHRVIFSSAYHS